MADLFLGIREEAGSFSVKNDDGSDGEKDYHYFLVNIALEDVQTTQNTVSYVGYDLLGIDKNGTVGDKPIYKDWRKIRPDNMASIFGTEVFNCDQFKSCVLKPCTVYFDKKGNMKHVLFDDGVLPQTVTTKK